MIDLNNLSLTEALINYNRAKNEFKNASGSNNIFVKRKELHYWRNIIKNLRYKSKNGHQE